LGLFEPLRLIVRHRALVWVLLRREVAIQTSGTALGGLWFILQPVLQIAAFWFLISVVLQVRMPGQVKFIDYFLMGMLPWLLISNTLQRGLAVLTEFSALYQRSVFPIRLLPLLPVLFTGLTFALIWPVVAGMVLGWSGAFAAVWLSILLLVWLLPLSYLMAMLGLFVADSRHAVPFLLTMTFFLTPIIYLPEQLPEGLRVLLILNPFADLMAIGHHVLQGMPLTLGNVARPVIIWVLLLGPAWVFFLRSEPHMREEL
jgi:lipopolysaccharide transport system permease protein